MKRKAFIVGAVIFLVIMTATGFSVFAEPVQLKGLKTVAVDIRIDQTVVELKEADFRTDIELKLRMAGVRVVPMNGAESRDGTLRIDLIAVEDNAKIMYSYGIRVDFSQRMVLPSRSDTSIFSTTWSRWMVGLGGKKKAPPVMKETVRAFVDEFINDYLAANPK